MISRQDTKAQETWIVTSEDTVRTTDEVVRTTEELVSTVDDAIQRVGVTEDEAACALVQAFGASVDAEYIPGKTRFRDALSEVFKLSQLDAEELCEALERSGRIRFQGGAEGAGWQIQATVESAAAGRGP